MARHKRRKPRRCPHVLIRGIYGDAINHMGGYRLICTECGTLLEGPVSEATVDYFTNKRKL